MMEMAQEYIVKGNTSNGGNETNLLFRGFCCGRLGIATYVVLR
jgi:hypothetical protein